MGKHTPLVCGKVNHINPPSISTQTPTDLMYSGDTPPSKPGVYVAMQLTGGIDVLKSWWHINPRCHYDWTRRWACCTVYDYPHPVDYLDQFRYLSEPIRSHVPSQERWIWEQRMQYIRTWKSVFRTRRYFPYHRRWVLRNLTAKEYVYAWAFTSVDGKGGGGGYDDPSARSPWHFTLGTLVAVNTCWADFDCNDACGLNVRGKWAGHCFDVVEEARLLLDMEAGGEWVDVTFREHTAMVKLYKENDLPILYPLKMD